MTHNKPTGLEDGFLELAQEQLERTREHVVELDGHVAELRRQRAAAANSVAQLDGLLSEPSTLESSFLNLAREQLDQARARVADLDDRIANMQHARTAAVHQAAHLEGLLNGPDAEQPATAPGTDPPAPPPPPTRKPFADADAVVNLIRERGAMHYVDIHSMLVERGFEIGGKGEADTLLSRYFNDPRLRRTARGTYDLAEQGMSNDGSASHHVAPADQRSERKGDPNLWLLTGRGGLNATGIFEDGKIRVRAGSRARKRTGNLSHSSQKALRIREQMIDARDLADRGAHYELVLDHVFDSPSLAAVVMSGVSLNGWRSWKNSEGLLLDEVHRQGAQKRQARKPFRQDAAIKKPRPPVR